MASSDAPIPDPLSVEDVARLVGEVEACSGDPEVAHSREDALHVRVLREIAGGAADPAGLAAVALLTGHIEFERWCA